MNVLTCAQYRVQSRMRCKRAQTRLHSRLSIGQDDSVYTGHLLQPGSCMFVTAYTLGPVYKGPGLVCWTFSDDHSFSGFGHIQASLWYYSALSNIQIYTVYGSDPLTIQTRTTSLTSDPAEDRIHPGYILIHVLDCVHQDSEHLYEEQRLVCDYCMCESSCIVCMQPQNFFICVN